MSTRGEFELSPDVKLAKDKPREVRNDLPLSNQVQPVVRKKLKKPHDSSVKKDFYANKSKTFRCWQYGELIVAESGYEAPSSAGKALLSKQGKQLTGFDFGETFCLHVSK